MDLPLHTTIALTVAASLVGIAKLGFLIWLFIRTKRFAAIAYGIYLVGFEVVTPYLESVVTERFRPPTYAAEWARSLFVLNLVNSLIETSLFIWLLWPLLKRVRRSDL